MRNLKISTRLSLLIGLLSMLLVSVGGIGLWGMSSSNEGLQTVYEDSVVPLEQLAEIQRRQLLNRLAIQEAMLDATPEQARSAADAVAQNKAAIDKLWASYMATQHTDEERQLARRFAEARGRFVQEGLLPTLNALLAANAGAAQQLERQARLLYAESAKALEALMALQIDVAKQEHEAASRHFETIRLASILSIAAGLLFGVLFGYLIVRGIGRQLGTEPAVAAALAESVAKGDLSVDIQLREGDSTSLLASLKTMRDGLSTVVSHVRQNAEDVAIASGQIAQGNLDLSQRTEEQASALEETAASMEQLTATVKQNAESARQASQLAMGASGVATQGGEVVSRVVDTMKRINDSSARIADIISVIDGIAFQTNILALNAAVEAARAGEQGRGFAVVASEVRTLAQRSANAAKEIKTLISASVERAEEGTRLVDQAGATMSEIVQSIRRVNDIVGEISSASTEQSAGIAQIGEAVAQLDQSTQQNAALVEEGSAAAEGLKSQAHKLVQTVATFRLAGAATGRSPQPAPPAPKAERAQRTGRQAEPRLTPALATSGDNWESF